MHGSCMRPCLHGPSLPPAQAMQLVGLVRPPLLPNGTAPQRPLPPYPPPPPEPARTAQPRGGGSSDDSGEPSTSEPSLYHALTARRPRNGNGSGSSGNGTGNGSTRASPHAPWLPGTSAAAAEGARLAAQLRACGDWYQLRVLVSTRRSSLNARHATGALSRLTAIAGYPMQVRVRAAAIGGRGVALVSL